MWVSTCVCMCVDIVSVLNWGCDYTCNLSALEVQNHSIKAYTPTSEQMTICIPIVWLVSHLVLTTPTKNHTHNQSPYSCLALPSNLNWCECSFKCLCIACAVPVSGPSPGICYIQLRHCFLSLSITVLPTCT